jgi:RNase adaptor protein for sRNA GlmZ degradation
VKLGSADTMCSNKAVAAIVDYLNAGHAVASIQTTCHAGTHRSVAAAEIIAQKMRRRGVSTVVTHAHRQRGPRDSF